MGRRKLTPEEIRARDDRFGEPEIVRPPLPKRPNLWYQPDIPIDFDDLIESGYGDSVKDCVSRVDRDLTKRYAKRWVWDASDELAIANGCRFDLKRAMHFAYTLRNELTLWEGRWSGEPFMLRTWQPECLLRVFGWVRPHQELGWYRRFSRASVWTCKKHGKSPTGAAVGIYIWRYDGVWDYDKSSEYYDTPRVGGGQHVYCMARNGKQAGIVWKHAANMCRSSPVIKADIDCGHIRLVEAWRLLKDQRTFSEFTTISGETKDELESSEGLNAAGLLVDEAHVVTDRQMEVVQDAGASQDNFLQFQFSTYGDSDGYGKKDLEYGKNVAKGVERDDAYFFKTYEAPQDLPDKECGEYEVWKRANPNLGFTVSDLKFQQAYDRAKNDPQQFAGWKRRRLNIWQRARNPMLDYISWEACGEPFGTGAIPEELKGCGGAAGLDLAQTEDWASFALAWDEGDRLNVWARIWTSEAWIENNEGESAPFQLWQQEGWLIAHDGDAIDFDEVQDDILQIMRWARCRTLGYDKQFGLQMAQHLQKRLAGCGIYKFGQSAENYAAGTAELKAAIKHRRLRHPANPAINWQAGHVKSKMVGNYEMPVKDPEAEHLKVDTIQAIVMAMSCKKLFMKPPPKPYMRIV